MPGYGEEIKMNIKFNVEDNFLDPLDAEKILREVTRENFPWALATNIAYDDSVPETNVLRAASKIDSNKNYGFIHHFYNSDGNGNVYISNFLPIIQPIVNKLNIKTPVRVKVNLYPNTDTVMEHGFHYDQHYPLQGAVYYVNSNNGYTLLKDGTRVASVANRMLFHDSSKEHSSTTCSNQKYRITINLNYF